MATADFSLKANDLLPSIQANLTTKVTNPDGTITTSVVDLSAVGTTVKFIMRAADANFVPVAGTPKVNATAVIVAPATGGVVRYDWVTGDTATPGNYVAEWPVTFPGGKVETFPTLTYHAITIAADLDGA